MPIRVYKSNGQVEFDSDMAAGGVCIGSVRVPAGQSYFKQWPLLAGCQIYAIFSRWMNITNVSEYDRGISYPNGVPTCSLPPISSERFITFFAHGSPGMLGVPGAQVVNSSNGAVINPNGRGLNYIGRATMIRNDSEPIDSPYTPYGDFGACIYRISYPEEPVIVIRMADGWRYSQRSQPVQVSPGVWEFAVSTKPSSPSHPAWSKGWYSFEAEVHCFARPTYAVPGPMFAIWDTDGALAYNLAGSLPLVAHTRLEFSGIDSSVYVPNRTPAMGIVGTPNYYEGELVYDGDNQDGSQGSYTYSFAVGSYQWTGNSIQVVRMPGGIYGPMGWGSYQSGAGWQPTSAVLIDLSSIV